MKEANNSNLIAAAQGAKPTIAPRTFEQSLEIYSPQFQKALGGSMPVSKFIRTVVSEVKANDALYAMAKRNPLSVVSSALKIATWGVNLAVPNEVFLVPWGGKVNAVTPMLGYKGLMRLALQAATELGISYKKFDARPIYLHDLYMRGFGSDTYIKHEPPKFGEPRGECVGFYAIAEDQFGRISHEEMTAQDMRAHKARFCKSSTGPWAKEENFERYGVKTMVRLLVSRHLPMTPKAALAVKEDAATEAGEELPDIDITPEAPAAERDPDGQLID